MPAASRNKASYVFGPVPSRRLGRSLGVDLVPFKTCTYDCIYCQLGRTTHKTCEREEWVPLSAVLANIEEKLSTNPDVITLSGSGEPSLYSRIGELISGIKDLTDIPIAVLTNGSLLWREDVRNQLLGAEMVIPSLDAGSAAVFQAVNRPHHGITFDQMLRGLVEFRSVYQGKYWLEVFMLGGYTTIEPDLAHLVACVAQVKPDLVQLNTVTRPPAEEFATAVPYERMQEIARMFTQPAEVITDYHGQHEEVEFVASMADVLSLLQRRPCTIADIADGLGMHRNEVVKYVQELLAQGKLERQSTGGTTYYAAPGAKAGS